MKLLMLSLLALASCGITNSKLNPVQVERSVLTIDRIQTQYRYPQLSYYVIWKDRRGIEYRERLNKVEDTVYMKKGMSFAQLLKR
ncbi:MAG: hypothetical protein ABIN89_08500 [Chitinophagaceae bacterium]